MSAKYRNGFDYFTEVFSKEYKVDKSILAGAAREVWENELTDEDRASWEEMARLSEQEESAAKAKDKKPEEPKPETKPEPKPEPAKAEEKKPEPKTEPEPKAVAIKAESKPEEKQPEPKSQGKKAEQEGEEKKVEPKVETKADEKKPEQKDTGKKPEAKPEEKKAEDKAEEKKSEPKAETKADESKTDARPEPKSVEKTAGEKPEDQKAESKSGHKTEEKKAEPKDEEKKPEPKPEPKTETKKPEPKLELEDEKKPDAGKVAEPTPPSTTRTDAPDFSSSRSPISGAETDMLGTPDLSRQPSIGVPPGIKEPAGMDAESPKEPEPQKTPPAAGAPAGAPSVDLDKLRQAIGKRVSSKEHEPAPKTSPEAPKPEPAQGPDTEQEQQHGEYRDLLSNTGYFTSSGPIKSGLTISANKPRQAAKEAPVERTSGGHAPESVPEIQDPSAVSLEAPSSAMMRQKLMDKADALADAVISKALDGDVQALTLCIERVLAPAEEYRLHIDLPPLDTQEHILQASEAVIRAVSLGELDPQQARMLHELIEAHWRILEGSELSHRVQQMEQRSGGVGKRQKITLGAFDKPF